MFEAAADLWRFTHIASAQPGHGPAAQFAIGIGVMRRRHVPGAARDVGAAGEQVPPGIEQESVMAIGHSHSDEVGEGGTGGGDAPLAPSDRLAHRVADPVGGAKMGQYVLASRQVGDAGELPGLQIALPGEGPSQSQGQLVATALPGGWLGHVGRFRQRGGVLGAEQAGAATPAPGLHRHA